MRRNPRAATRSYTLIELIIVMAVLALAAALLVPNFVGRDSLTLQTAVRLVISDLSFAQSDALANQEFRRVVFYSNGSGYAIIRILEEDDDTPADPANWDYIVDPLHSMGRYIVNFATDHRFEGVVIDADTNIDGTTLPDQPEVTYDAMGGTVQKNGLAGIGGFVVLKFGNVRYQLNIAAFTGKLTVVEL